MNGTVTRKRFVKLLISRGWSRNRGNAEAKRLRAGCSYEALYYYIRYTAPTVGEVIARLCDAVAEAANSLDALSAAMATVKFAKNDHKNFD